MLFINPGEYLKVRLGTIENYYWISIRKGEIKDLPEEIGRVNGLIEFKATEGQIGKIKVETKQVDNFYKELTDIQGIGPKTAKDIMEWGTKRRIIAVIKEGGTLPFRDDVAKLLGDKYGI